MIRGNYDCNDDRGEIVFMMILVIIVEVDRVVRNGQFDVDYFKY